MFLMENKSERTALTLDQKIQIIEYVLEKKTSIRTTANVFAVKYGRSISVSIVGRIMQQKDKILQMKAANATNKRFRVKSDKLLEFEAGVMNKIEKALAKSQKLYKEQVLFFARKIQESMPDAADVQATKLSQHWWESFRDAYKIKFRRICGNKKTVVTGEILAQIKIIRDEIAKYDPANVLNLD